MKTIAKIVLAIMCIIQCTGCYASQRDNINAYFDRSITALDSQCKQNMNQWCRMQYQILAARHDESLANDSKEVSEGNHRGWVAGIAIAGLAFIVGMVAWGMASVHN